MVFLPKNRRIRSAGRRSSSSMGRPGVFKGNRPPGRAAIRMGKAELYFRIFRPQIRYNHQLAAVSWFRASVSSGGMIMSGNSISK